MKARRFILGAGLAALALLLLATAAALLLRSAWLHEQIRARIIQETERATGGRAEIARFHFDWRQLRAQVSRFVLHGKESSGEPPLFSARVISLDLKVISFLRRDIILAGLTLDQPSLHIIVYPDGSTNLPEPPVKRQRRDPVEQFLDLGIRQFQIREGLVAINERRFPIDVTGENLAARLAYDAAGPRYTGKLSFQRLRLERPDQPLPPFDADFTINLDHRRLALEPARLTTNGSVIDFRATIENLLSPLVRASFQARLNVQEWIPPQAAGSLSGAAHLDGDFTFENSQRFAVEGKLSSPSLAVRHQDVTLAIRDVSAGLSLLPDSLALSGLRLSALGGRLAGGLRLDHWRQFRWTGQAEDISLAELARLRNVKAESWQGTLSGPSEVEGEIASGSLTRIKASGDLAVQGSMAERPVDGRLIFAFDQVSRTLEVRESWLATPSSKLHLDGALEREIQVSVETSDLNDVAAAASLAGASLPSPLPVRLNNGSARFNGVVAGELSNLQVRGRLAASNLAFEQYHLDKLQAEVEATKDYLRVASLQAAHNSARIDGQGRVSLIEWKPEDTSEIRGEFRLRGMPLEELAAEAGLKEKLRGALNASFQVAGTVAVPRLSGWVETLKAQIYGEPLDSARADVKLDGHTLRLDPVRVSSGKARLEGYLSYESKSGNWKQGKLSFELGGRDVRLAQVRGLAGVEAAVDGQAAFNLEGEAYADGDLRLALLHGRGSLRDVTLNRRPAGQLDFSLETQGDLLELTGAGRLAAAPLQLRLRTRLHGDYQTEGEVRFGELTLSTVSALLAPDSSEPLPVEMRASGRLSFAASLVKAGEWKAELELPSLSVEPLTREARTALTFVSTAPVRVSINPKQASLQRARLAGDGTSVEASGRVIFAARGPQFDLRIVGNADLGVLARFDPNITASGVSQVDVSLRGPVRRPDLYGQLRISDASFYLKGVPNGIDGANGVIFLFRDRATIERLTARTGGGTLSLQGFVGFAAERPFYQLNALARQVRVRYPEGVSTTFDASLDLRGTSQRSVLTGSASILRSSISPNLDFASILSRPAQPFAPPASPNEMLNGMQLDLSVTTAPNARFENSLARNLQAEADLRIQGTPYKPVLLGRISINQGEINFLGNRYRISRGDITFANPFRIEPLLDLDLNTRVRGVEVTMNFTGPADKLNLTYRSDPPLQVNEIIALLAVGRAPSNDPAVLTRQTQADQSWQQLSANTLVGAAFETLEGGRLQRFFGVSRIKIDPKLTGLGNVPEAQFTLEQQVSRDITFTYVTKLAQEQQQLVRVEWNVSRQWSLLAVRDENGLFGIEVQFRRQFK